MAVVRELAEAVRKTNNAVLTDSVAQKAANRLGVAPDAVRTEFRKPGANRPAAPTEEAIPASAAEPELPPPPAREAWMLRLTLCEDAADHMEWLMAHLDPQWITDGDVRQLIETLVSLRTSDRWRGEASMLAELEIPRQQVLLNDAAMQQRAIPNVAQQLQDVVLQLRNEHYDRELKRLTLLFASPEFDEAARHEALHRRTALLALKRQPLQPLSDAA
jgi:DNA primase